MESIKKSRKKPLNLPFQKNCRILVVEDESIIALDLQNILEKFGFEVCCVVSSGKESIRAATQVRPDLVLMDVKLKGNISGIEAAKQIHKSLSIPVIYLTAFSDLSTVQDALEHKDFSYIRKPFEEREVEKTIHKTLKRLAREKSSFLG